MNSSPSTVIEKIAHYRYQIFLVAIQTIAVISALFFLAGVARGVWSIIKYILMSIFGGAYEFDGLWIIFNSFVHLFTFLLFWFTAPTLARLASTTKRAEQDAAANP